MTAHHREHLMAGTRSQAAVVAALALVLSMLVSGCDGAAPAAVPDVPSRADLQARVEALEGLIPDQAHIMADVGYHFTNLWFAGTAENWPLADFYLAETKSHLHWAVRRIPIRKDNQGKEVNLVNILEAFENSQLSDLKRTIDGRDEAAFERSYREAITMCYSCHKAADKPFLRPRIPESPDTHIINFDPKADWPL
jgi:cytochrome c553